MKSDQRWCGIYLSDLPGHVETERETPPAALKFLITQIGLIEGMWVSQYGMWRFDEDTYQINIYFGAVNTERLPELLYWLNPCHKGGDGYWEMTVRTDCACSPVHYTVNSTKSTMDQLLKECMVIGEAIKEDQEAIEEEDENLEGQTLDSES